MVNAIIFIAGGLSMYIFLYIIAISKGSEKRKYNNLNEYLLSDERRELYKRHPVFGKENLNERLSEISHSDIANYKFICDDSK